MRSLAYFVALLVLELPGTGCGKVEDSPNGDRDSN
jgi:hypothetical protein